MADYALAYDEVLVSCGDCSLVLFVSNEADYRDRYSEHRHMCPTPRRLRVRGSF